jgi:diaminohydroxyphosphoribosylaminopyrimidine deaminase / 5-amino-6-(5-phosphoribosylamino)uracil reductase
MQMNADEAFLRHAIRLAMNGRGSVEPNPMVGCVIVKNNRVIGEGFHEHYGHPHAEPNALKNCSESPEGAAAYVTLEPCCHTNKQTPPCAPRLIEAKLARVVIGCFDPNPAVNGNGVAMLRSAGINVETGLLEDQCKQLIAPFLAAVNFHRPYVTLKWAQSSNGLVAGRLGKPVRITNELSTKQVHLLRSRCDAIAVGTNTVLNDDPLLTVRGVKHSRPLLRVILSNTLRFPLDAKLIASAIRNPVLLYCSQQAFDASTSTVEVLREKNVEVIALPDRDGHFSFSDVLKNLHARNVMHLLIEPGPTLARSMLSRGQADRIWVFRSPKEIEAVHGESVSRAPEVVYPESGKMNLGEDELTEYLNPHSEVFYSNSPSADFVRASV